MIKLVDCKNRERWLEHRKKGLGGSDMGAVLGMNPWMSNVQLWEYKTGRKVQPDISDKPFVKYGTDAEKFIRGLFALDHPELRVCYLEHNSWINSDYPWALASLDGWTFDEHDRQGILEIKTSEIMKSTDWDKWDGKIPQTYYCQVLFYMAVTGAEYADLRAAIRYSAQGEKRTMIRDYHIEREEVNTEIDVVMDEGARFWRYVTEDTAPPLKLPEIRS